MLLSRLEESIVLHKKNHKSHKNHLILFLFSLIVCTPWVFSQHTYHLEVCNKIKDQTVYTSVAFYDHNKNSWVGKGWFPTDQDSCTTLMRHIQPPVYVYAESIDGDLSWGDKAEKDQGLFCIHDAAPFEIQQENCDQTGMRWQQFRKLPTPNLGGTLTWVLDPE